MIYVLESESINIYLHIVYNCMTLFSAVDGRYMALEEWTHAPYHPGNIKSLLQTKNISKSNDQQNCRTKLNKLKKSCQ